MGNGNIANQIHAFTIDYGKFMLTTNRAEVENQPFGYTDILWPATNLALYLEPAL